MRERLLSEQNNNFLERQENQGKCENLIVQTLGNKGCRDEFVEQASVFASPT